MLIRMFTGKEWAFIFGFTALIYIVAAIAPKKSPEHIEYEAKQVNEMRRERLERAQQQRNWQNYLDTR